MKNKMYIMIKGEYFETSLKVKKEKLNTINEELYQNILSIQNTDINNKGKFYINLYHVVKDLRTKEISEEQLKRLYELKESTGMNNEIINKIVSNINIQKLKPINDTKDYISITKYFYYLGIDRKKYLNRSGDIKNVKK